MEETTRWIMGLGPLVVNTQFVKDIGRRSVPWYLNGIPISKNPSDAMLRIYEECGFKYYSFSKYFTQTMGNMMYSHVQQMHWKGILTQVKDSYQIRAYSKKCNQVYAEILFDMFDRDFRRCGCILVVSMIDLDTNHTRIKVKRL
tara:strand:+ start:483 stop:914 length:432 start_codon:yes stop_codon:yes gene_type:complete